LFFGQAIAIDIAREHPWTGIGASTIVLLTGCWLGWAPSATVGAVVVCCGDAMRKQKPTERLPYTLLVLIVPALVAYVPFWLDWRSSPVFAGAARHASADNAMLILLVATILRADWRSLSNLLTREKGRVAEVEAERDRAVVDERARIARELHDVVAHQMSVVVTQAQGAAAVVESDPDRARRALETIASTARDGLVEMRRLVDVDGPRTGAGLGDPTTPVPQFTLDDVARLFTSAENAGVTIDAKFNSRSGGEAIPAGVAASAYRVLQEALTNAAKHATGSAVQVDVDEGEATFVVSVTNGPGRGRAADIPGTGLGLVGMRERVEFFGGTLHAGPTAEGGWSVVASFPTLEVPPTTTS
jgi:signal transduction histidine kinase